MKTIAKTNIRNSLCGLTAGLPFLAVVGFNLLLPTSGRAELVGQWVADDWSGGIDNWVDRVGGKIATVPSAANSPVKTPGAIVGSLNKSGIVFDGINDYLVVANTQNPIVGKTSVTIVAFFNATRGATPPDGAHWRMPGPMNGESPGSPNDWGLTYNAAGNAQCFFNGPVNPSPVSLIDGQPHTMIMTWQDPSVFPGQGIARVYVDGVLIGERAQYDGGDGIVNDRFVIGADEETLRRYFTGAIGELRFYDSIEDPATLHGQLTGTTVICPPAVTVGCTFAGGTTRTVTIGVGDVNDAPLTVEWSVDSVIVATHSLAAGASSDSLVDHVFSPGPHTVSVSVTGGALDPVICGTTVTVVNPGAPVPTLESLPDLIGECPLTIGTAPTAGDCDGATVFPGTTDQPLPLTFDTPGEYMITWTYKEPHMDPSAECQLAQYASSLIDFSTQYPNRRAVETLGPPNTFSYGIPTTIWLPWPPNNGSQFVTVGFATPVLANGATIRETYGNGFVNRIDVLDTNGALHTVWTGTDPSPKGSPVDFFVPFPETTFQVKGLKIYADTNLYSSYEAIDAITLHGNGCLTSSQTQKVIVRDTTPPTITCPADVTVPFGGEPAAATTPAEFLAQGGTITDHCDPNGTVYSEDTSEGHCPIVIKRTYYATDAAGNASDPCVQTITVDNLFAEDGILWLQPLARKGMSSDTDPSDGGTLKYRFKLGSTIPIKVQAQGCDGNVSSNANVGGKIVVFGDTDMDGVVDANEGELLIDYNGVGEAGGVMDKVDGKLQFNLDTKKLVQTFKCYILQVTVTDSSTGESRVETLALQSK